MSTTDPFEHDDAAYVLGALSNTERAAFEAHLPGCEECLLRVQEISNVPALLREVDVADVLVADEPLPDTLLPRLLREVSARRRRARALIGGLAVVAAGCVAALVIALWPSASTPAPAGQPFSAIGQVPVVASAVLTPTQWGTAIRLDCYYTRQPTAHALSYSLVVYDKAGNRHVAGDWTVPRKQEISFTTGTSLTRDQIAKLVITLPDGTPVLRLRT